MNQPFYDDETSTAISKAFRAWARKHKIRVASWFIKRYSVEYTAINSFGEERGSSVDLEDLYVYGYLSVDVTDR